MSPELRVLLAKEWRQLVRSKGAMASSLLLPLLLLLIIPMAQMLGMALGGGGGNLPPGVSLPPVMERLRDNPRLVGAIFLPIFVTAGGMVAPSIAATYTLVAERETKTIELLLALPVRIGQVLWAKLLAILLLTVPLTSVLLAIDCGVGLVLGLLEPLHVVAFFLLLFAAVTFSTTSALLIALLARDFRTANNLNGLLFGPALLLGIGVVFTLPGLAAPLVLTALFTVAAAACAFLALKVITFERLLR